MDAVSNPYEPGAGRRPPELAGRSAVVRAVEVLMDRCETGRGGRGRVLHGLRGVGKTVLLDEFHAQAQHRGWVTAKVEGSSARPELAPRIAQGLYRSLREVTGRRREGLPARLVRALRVFRSFSVTVDPAGTYSFGVDVEALSGHADSGDLSSDLTDLLVELGGAASELGIGVALVVDEMQELTRTELTALNLAAHQVGQGAEPLPVVVLGAGLPSLPAVLAEATSYAERLFEYDSIGALSRDAAVDALVLPASALGVEWSEAALEEVLEASAGYPFALQSCGRFVWDHAIDSPISADDALVGLAMARREMDAGIYLSRWNRATPVQRQVLRAMAEHGEGADVPTADVATALGRRRGDLSVPRDQLIKKGLVYAPERGLMAFTVPGMAEFVLRQVE